MSVRGLRVGEAYAGDPPDRFSDSPRIVMLGLARLGSGFFGRAAAWATGSEHEDEPEELLSLPSLSHSLIDEEGDEEEADDPSPERAPSKTPSPRFCERSAKRI